MSFADPEEITLIPVKNFSRIFCRYVHAAHLPLCADVFSCQRKCGGSPYWGLHDVSMPAGVESSALSRGKLMTCSPSVVFRFQSLCASLTFGIVSWSDCRVGLSLFQSENLTYAP